MLKDSKRLFSFVLALVLLAGLCVARPVPARAVTAGDFDITFTSGSGSPAWSTDYTYVGDVLTIIRDGDYTITMATPGATTTDRIVVYPGINADITLSGVRIDQSTLFAPAFNMNGATVRLTLVGANDLTGGSVSSGLNVPGNSNLTITAASTGSLTATSGSGSGSHGGAGIGGSSDNVGGTITIAGGTIIANGSGLGAGIGGGYFSSGGTITITGGTITATGGTDGGRGGAGIGGGGLGDGGTITITGGAITATGGNGTSGGGAGIGGGSVASSGTITITGGTIIATGGNGGLGAPGIGGLMGGSTIVLIYGESTDVTATKGSGTGSLLDIGSGGTTAGTVFVALPPGKLRNATQSIGNEVTFSATPGSSGTVTAALPAPWSSTINILTGLANPKLMSVFTTLDTDSIAFGLPGYASVMKTGTELMASNATVPFAALSPMASATVSNATIGGVVGSTLGGGQTATIALVGDTVADTMADVDATSWFANLPAGLTVTANATAGSNTITLNFGGTPTETSAAQFSITIPGNVLTGNANLAVADNTNARFHITGQRPSSELPRTGDGFPMAALLALVGVSLLGLGWMLYGKRKAQRRNG